MDNDRINETWEVYYATVKANKEAAWGAAKREAYKPRYRWTIRIGRLTIGIWKVK